MHHPTDRITHTTAFVTPVMEHWLEREIAQWVHPMKDQSDDPSHYERMLLPRSYISLCIVIDTTDCYIPALLLINISENKFRIIGFLPIAFVGIYMDFSWKQLKVISLQNLYICLYNVCGFMLCESVYIFTLKRYRGILLKHWILFNIIKNLYLSLK